MKEQTKTQVKEELKEDYFLVNKKHFLRFFIIIILIGFLIWVSISIIDSANRLQQQGRVELMNEIFKSYDNLQCGEGFELINNYLDDMKVIIIKKENCLGGFNKLILNNSGQFKSFSSWEEYEDWMSRTTGEWDYNEDGSVNIK